MIPPSPQLVAMKALQSRYRRRRLPSIAVTNREIPGCHYSKRSTACARLCSCTGEGGGITCCSRSRNGTKLADVSCIDSGRTAQTQHPWMWTLRTVREFSSHKLPKGQLDDGAKTFGWGRPRGRQKTDGEWLIGYGMFLRANAGQHAGRKPTRAVHTERRRAACWSETDYGTDIGTGTYADPPKRSPGEMAGVAGGPCVGAGLGDSSLPKARPVPGAAGRAASSGGSVFVACEALPQKDSPKNHAA